MKASTAKASRALGSGIILGDKEHEIIFNNTAKRTKTRSGKL